MGWTSYNASCYKNGKVDVKAECDRYIANYTYCTLVKSAMVGSTYYAAVKSTVCNAAASNRNNIGDVFAIVMLTSVDNSDYYNFSYKMLSEYDGPGERKCPMSIIKLLSPVDSEWANEWRNDCIAYAEKKKSPNSISKLPVGSRIRFETASGPVVLIKRDPAYQFKRAWWQVEDAHGYWSAKNIPAEYEVLA